MNLLAHFFLSQQNESLIVGNFIADDVKGKDYLIYSNEIQQGILLHRLIDDFTDKHVIVNESKSRIRVHQQKYTPVVMDVFYDYFLAKHWNSYSKEQLLTYSLNIYKTLQKHQSILPEKSAFRLKFMEKQNWLYNYRNIDGIEHALKGLSSRASFTNNMNIAHQLLLKHEISLFNDFKQFFPELISFVTKKPST